MLRAAAVILTILLTFSPCLNALAAIPYDSPELLSGYITIVDEKGAVVLQTGLEVHPGDEYISEDNRRYEVIEVDGNLARARYLGEEGGFSMQGDNAVPVQAAAQPQPPLIGIYSTHTDEAYIPTDGKSNIPGKGSILEVGASMAQKLEANGFRTLHSRNLHDPHDANAYQRSRRTAIKLIKEQPAMLFDIHRDTAPLNVYSVNINGQPASRILLVVGRQNQNRQSTLNFAKRIKASADEKYRGLIRGIFMAHGNYNQDLGPQVMLLEIGSMYNSLDAAQRSAALFADVIPSLLSPRVATAEASAETETYYSEEPAADTGEGGFLRDILYMTGALIAGIAAYLYLSTGSFSEAKNKVQSFFSRELGDLFRSKRKKR